MEKQIHDKIKAFIEKNRLIDPGDELILGVSGGADSMMMLHYFFSQQANYQITLKVAHIHHGLREEATLDAQLVQETCEKYHLPFYRHDCQIETLAKQKKISQEEAGRQERYNFFISLLNEKGKIVTAHNMNDQAETMIMRFLRGADIKGLCGIMPKRGVIIRPLLCLTREEIEGYCKALQVPFRHDETNFKPIYTRNKIRLTGIPYIKETLNPNIINTLAEHSEVYQESNDFLEAYTQEAYKACCKQKDTGVQINPYQLRTYHPYMQKRIFMMAMEHLSGVKDITSKHLESCISLIAKQVGRSIQLPHGIRIKKDYEGIVLQMEQEKETQQDYCYPLEEGDYQWGNQKLRIVLNKLTPQSYVEKQRINQKNENNYTKYIDYGRIKSGLQIRTRWPQDFIQLGNGTKKLKKFFVDEKISGTLRDQIPLIADKNEIVWVIGSRLNTTYYVTENTQEILEIKILKGHE